MQQSNHNKVTMYVDATIESIELIYIDTTIKSIK